MHILYVIETSKQLPIVSLYDQKQENNKHNGMILVTSQSVMTKKYDQSTH
jgi:hypothetical protein